MDTQTNNFLKILKSIFDKQNEILLDEPVNWEVLSETARKQNLLPLFFEAAAVRDDYRNSGVFQKDQLDTFGMVAAQIQRSNAFLETYKKITEQGIFPIVMKGIVCRQLYGKLGEHRPSADEDILVEVKDFSKVRKILEQENFVCSVPDITERELNRIQEVSFYNWEQKLSLDVHMNMIGKKNEERKLMDGFFQKIHEHGQMMQIYGIEVKVPEPTEFLLFLILHAYKHFRYAGVGIRQMMDTLLYYREYKNCICMESLQNALKTCRAEKFWLDILYIGNQYLGLCEEMPETSCCPEELLQDLIHTGVFGGRDRKDHMAARVNSAVVDDERKQSKGYMLFKAAFPSKSMVMDGYPYLVEKPWLLPAVWAKRWIKFARYAGKDVWKVSREILQKSSVRMEMIKKYKR